MKTNPTHTATQQKHQTFVTQYLLTGDAVQAYTTAYPNAHGEAARAAASRLLARPEIATQIAQAQQQARSTAVAALEVVTSQHLQQEYVSIAEKRAILAKMIGGDWKRKRYINLRQRVELVEEGISNHALLRAIELDTKLAIMQEQLVAIEVKEEATEDIEEGSEEQIKRSIPFPKYGDKEAMRFWCNYHYGEGYYDKIATGDGTPANPLRPNTAASVNKT
ncbi:MAG: terminase small subunit [Flavipsychrobacter sp.]